MSLPETQENHICPVCGSANTEDALSKREYRCPKCNLELAHLDVAANGVIRGIFGWLRSEGDTIEGRYRVKSVLGKGGFGATYLVEDLRLNGKRRALKEVPTLLFDEYETTLLSRLNHPSIPDIVDRTEADGMIYLVLEFGGSRTLGGERKEYPKQRIPQAKLLPWMRQLCEVLIYLHSQDPPIIHRDLKPDNILLDENGRIMLIDFGIAKESKPATMTRTLGRAATHGFSPPEQAMGTGTDERSDIYAMAATFYALLTGENPPAAHERVAGKELMPPAQFVPEISPELEDAILHALNLNVNRRQQSVLEFSQALDGIDSSGWAHPLNNTAYTDRTVMIGKSSASTAMHPPSIKLPSGRITAATSVPVSETAPAQQVSKRNAIILGTGITVVLAVLLISAYLLWPEPTPEQEQKAQPLVGNEKAEPTATGEPAPVGSTTGQTPTESLPAMIPAPVGASKDSANSSKSSPIDAGNSSALQELEKRLGKQGDAAETDNNAADLAKQNAENEARLRAEEDRKRLEAKRRADEERKRIRARQVAKQRAVRPQAQPQDDWLKEFAGSQSRRK